MLHPRTWITKRPTALVLAALLLAGAPAVDAGWQDWLKKAIGPESSGSQQTPAAAQLSTGELTQGLKEALRKGVDQAISLLGRRDGFLGDPQVKIPVPRQVESIASTLRKLGQGKLVDQFETTLNRAAEAAVPETGAILKDSISQMTLEDAKGILQGPDDAATQYFRRTSEDRLREKILPIVRRTTDQAGVTSSYKKLTGSLGSVASLLGQSTPDLDGYVTNKTLDGLFTMIAQEEKQIRENPVARTTELLKKVFGAAF